VSRFMFYSLAAILGLFGIAAFLRFADVLLFREELPLVQFVFAIVSLVLASLCVKKAQLK